MATNLSKSIEEQVTCPICLEQFQDPRILPCLHTYCKHCLEDLLDRGTRRFSIQCPECRETFQVDEDVSSLRVNIWVNRYLSLLELSKVEKESGATVLMCNNCDSNEPAKGRCFDCEKFVCDYCITAHQRMEVLKNHQLMTLEEIKDKGIPPMEKPTLCDKHKGKKQKLFCEQCEVLICKDCTLIDHKDHDMSFISEIVDKHKEQLLNRIEAVGNAKEEIESALETVKNMQEKVRQNAEGIEQEIDVKIDKKIQTLEELRTSLKQESRNVTAIKMKRLSAQQDCLEMHLTSLKSAVEFTENILAKGSNSDVLSMVKQVSSRFSELSDKKIDDEVDNEDQQVLVVNENTTCEDLINFLKVKDLGSPDPAMCEVHLGFSKGGEYIFLRIRNFKNQLIEIKKNRILIDCPFQVNELMPFGDNWRFNGQFRFSTPRNPGNCDVEVMVDGHPMKGSPVRVCRIW